MYVARYTESKSSNTIELRLDAVNYAEAVAEVQKIVEDGFRNETQCQVDLTDGRVFGASNVHGSAKGAYL